MPPSLSRSPYLAVLVAFALPCAACTVLSPQVGASQESCGIPPVVAGGTASSSASGGSYPAAAQTTSSATPQDTVCAADAGSACDDCEAKWCCTQRLACYSNPVCICNDNAMDMCQAAAGSNANAAADCWNAFAAGGTVEATRLGCVRAWCASACGVQ